MSDLTELIARVRTNPRDDATWLVIADLLTQSGDPIGEYIVLSLKYGISKLPDAKKRRMRKLAREWEARFAPRSKFEQWWRWGIRLRYPNTDAIFADADSLRLVHLPLELGVGSESRSIQKCFVDDGFTRLAWMEKTETVENQNHSPGMDEDWSHWREVRVWRVADRAVLFERSFEATWDRLEFRADGLYALENDRALLLDAAK